MDGHATESESVALCRHVARYAKADDRTAWRLVASSFAAYALALAAGKLLLDALRGATDWQHRTALALASTVAVMALAGEMVRVFLLQHDLCHGGFFTSRKLCRIIAPLAGTVVSTSPSVWQKEHNRHHRDSNNLDRPQDGETASWTVDAYQRSAAWQRWAYFVLNQRLALFVVIPVLYFLGFMRVRARWYENALFLVFALALYLTGAWLPFLLAFLLATWFGFLVFHAQHTFEGVMRRSGSAWNFVDNALYGSSLLVVPEHGILGAWLRRVLLSVPYHHVHHLHPGVPAYRLASCHADAGAMLDPVRRVTIFDALRSTRYTLFDEASASLVTFAGLEPWKSNQRDAPRAGQ
jgi:omega-6 fatty acid desaturase (delta-12 desaturase)